LSEFYLKGFCPAAELWVYDREKDEHRKLPPEKVAIRKDFYAVEGPNGEKDYAEVERRLGVVENQAAPAIRKLDAGAKLELRERYALAMFVALLKFRTPAFERQTEAFNSMVADLEQAKGLLAPSVEAVRIQLKQLGYDSPELPDLAQGVYDHIHEEGVQHWPGPNAHLEAMLGNAYQLGREFVLKAWTVARSPEGCPFITSDLPLAMVAAQDAQDPLLCEEPDIMPPGYEAWVPLSRSTLLIIGNEALSGRYIQLDEPAVHSANVMVAAQCERFFMAGDEESLMRTARALPKEIVEGWTLPGRMDLSGYLGQGHGRSVGRSQG
jgi:hypothetical protein